MKKFIKNSGVATLIVSFVVVALGLAGPTPAYAATTPSLGAAASYAILASSFINTFAGTTVNGDIGFTTGPAVRPLGVQQRYGSGYPYSTAGTDQGSALAPGLSSQGCTFTFAAGAIDLSTNDGTGGTGTPPTSAGVFGPGVWCTQGAGAASIGAGGITLSGAGTYIFRIAGALTSVNGSIVTLTGASACDVFWTPTGATSLGTTTTFKGIVIGDPGITVGANTNWSGKALAFGGVVTTGDTSNITVPTACAGTPPGNPSQPPVLPFPLINVTKIPNPLALPSGSGSVTYTYEVTNVGVVAMNNVQVTDDKCGPVQFISGDSDNDSMLDVTEAWVYRCTKTISQTETNTVTARGSANGGTVYDTAIATVAVGVPVVPPLIHLVKRPNVFVLPVGGGPVTYSYTVTNPGTEPLDNVFIADDKCTGLPGRVVGHPGDLNNNNLLESNESWSFTCQTNISQTTTNTGTAEGHANGLTALDYSRATVVVAGVAGGPGLPAAGRPSEGKGIPWNIAIAGILVLVSASVVTLRKRTV